jgi:hypothetical protein
MEGRRPGVGVIREPVRSGWNASSRSRNSARGCSSFVKNGNERLVVFNRIAKSVVHACRGISPAHVFTYKVTAITRMMIAAWKRAGVRQQLQANAAAHALWPILRTDMDGFWRRHYAKVLGQSQAHGLYGEVILAAEEMNAAIVQQCPNAKPRPARNNRSIARHPRGSTSER